VLAAQGRGGDTEVAHLSPGKVVLPRSLQTPELMHAIAALAHDRGIDVSQITVGSSANRFNPQTATAQFQNVIDNIPVIWRRPRSGVPSMTLPASSSYFDTIESRMNSTVQQLLAEGWEFLPDGLMKAPNGQIVAPATEEIVVADRRPRRQPPQDRDDCNANPINLTLRRPCRLDFFPVSELACHAARCNRDWVLCGHGL
jgi:hypothetical protein